MASKDKVADAEEAKAQGNACLQSQDFDKAIEWYTQAINLHENHVYYSNRSAAYLSKGYAESALKDSEACIRINPTWAKGFSRKGAALHKLKQYEKSIAAYQKGLEFEPENQGLVNGLKAVQDEQNAPDPGAGAAGALGGMFKHVMEIAQAHPKLKIYMEDPSYVQMLETVKANPMMMQMYMNDPRFMETVQELIGMNPDIMAQTRKVNAEMEGKQEEEKRKQEIERKKREEEEKKRQEEEAFNALPEEEKQKVLQKKEAVEWKGKGNDLYKQKKFDEAIEMYDKAIELNPDDMSFLTNKAAVILEKGDLEGCIELCNKAIAVGKSNHADYGLIAKAYARIGNAYLKHKEYQKAADFYTKAQLEKKSNDVDKKLKLAQKKLREQDAKAYIDPEKAKEAKEAGNEKFKGGEFPEAVKLYSEAIKRDPECAVYYNNRAAAYMKLADFGRAMDDCKAALKIDPKYLKAYSRKGNVELYLKEYHKAMDTFKAGLEIDPENAECKDGLNKTMYAVQSGQGENSEERARRAMEDPEIRNIMSDPVMKSVLQEMQTNPAAAQQHMSNPEVSGKIQKLIAAGILQTR